MGGVVVAPLERGVGLPPPQPYWPLEFVSDALHVNTTSNATQMVRMSFSAANNGTINEFYLPANETGSYVVYQLYNYGTQFAVGGPPGGEVCEATPLVGGLVVPPVQEFAYAGTTVINNEPAWAWTAGSVAVYYTTQDADEYPLGYVDLTHGAAILFTGFAPTTPAGWPAGYWAIPYPC